MNHSTSTEYAGLTSFCLRYIIFFGILASVFYFAAEKSDVIRDYIEWHTDSCSKIFNSLFGEKTTIHVTERGFHNALHTHDRAFIHINFGGMGYFVSALIAGVVAWPSESTKRKIAYALGAALLGVVLHFTQSIALLEIEIWWSKHLSLLSEVILPIGLGLIAMLYFALWMRASGRHPMG